MEAKRKFILIILILINFNIINATASETLISNSNSTINSTLELNVITTISYQEGKIIVSSHSDEIANQTNQINETQLQNQIIKLDKRLTEQENIIQKIINFLKQTFGFKI